MRGSRPLRPVTGPQPGRGSVEENRAADLAELRAAGIPVWGDPGPQPARSAVLAASPALVSGRHLTWYGPSLVEAPEILGRQLRAAAAGRARE
jgi:hypothetical protein